MTKHMDYATGFTVAFIYKCSLWIYSSIYVQVSVDFYAQSLAAHTTV